MIVRILLLPFIAGVYMIYHPLWFVALMVGCAVLLIRRRRQQLG
jgi:hypothetical protein